MEFDRERYKVYTWKSWMMLHWIINPGLVINELLLGQRIPKVSLVDRHSDAPWAERQLIPCPHCDTLHDGRIYAKKKGFKNWFGMYCPACGGVIPCLMNATTAIILTLTAPLWIWFYRPLRKRWLRMQAGRFGTADVDLPNYEPDGKGWLEMSLGYGSFMFLFNVPFKALIFGEQFSLTEIMAQLVIWMLGGLAFGITMHYVMAKRGKGALPEEDTLDLEELEVPEIEPLRPYDGDDSQIV